MKNLIAVFIYLLLLISGVSCSEDEYSTTKTTTTTEPSLIVKFKFDTNQVRLDGTGQPASVAAGNAAQNPIFNAISAHYLELTPNALTQVGQGTIVYRGAETVVGGANAIDFGQAKIMAQDDVFLKIPLKDIAAGSYEFLRVSLTYQNFGINILNSGVEYPGTLASFVGINTYIGTFNIGNNQFNVNGNRAQGYWAFAIDNQPFSSSGQAPAGATTVPNPLAATSPIPTGSCLVTGKFANNLVISGNETRDVRVTLSLSINNSFEWKEVNFDGKFEPASGESVVDMGLRGLIPSFVK